MLWVLLTVHFPGEPATRAGNPGIARGSKPVAEVYTAARAVEWLIRLTFRVVISALEVQVYEINSGSPRYTQKISWYFSIANGYAFRVPRHVYFDHFA